MTSKTIILTIDYELFFGSDSGTVHNSMVVPTQKLMQALSKYGWRMTVFWDILHYVRLLELEDEYPQLKEDRCKIKKQIQDLAKAGHDIQMHLHPHWVNAKYDRRWMFSYEYYSLDSLAQWESEVDTPLKSVEGCVRRSIEIMTSLISPIVLDYKITTFRAGGWCIEPFEKIGPVFKKYGIKIDSSISAGICSDSWPAMFDFRPIELNRPYRFETSVLKPNEQGSFLELPIFSINRSICYLIFRKAKELLVKKISKSKNVPFGDGQYIGFGKKNWFERASDRFMNIYRPTMINLEALHKDWPLYKTEAKRVKFIPVMIGHPKGICPQTIEAMEMVCQDGFQFGSIHDLITCSSES
jgi:hypothetical protein